MSLCFKVFLGILFTLFIGDNCAGTNNFFHKIRTKKQMHAYLARPNQDALDSHYIVQKSVNPVFMPSELLPPQHKNVKKNTKNDFLHQVKWGQNFAKDKFKRGEIHKSDQDVEDLVENLENLAEKKLCTESQKSSSFLPEETHVRSFGKRHYNDDDLYEEHLHNDSDEVHYHDNVNDMNGHDDNDEVHDHEDSDAIHSQPYHLHLNNHRQHHIHYSNHVQ